MFVRTLFDCIGIFVSHCTLVDILNQWIFYPCVSSLGIVYLMGGKTEVSELHKEYSKKKKFEKELKQHNQLQERSIREPPSLSSSMNTR